jgi:hypothetical protein
VKIGRPTMPDMTPEQFIAKWQTTDLKERAAAQSHFNDLLRPARRAEPDRPRPDVWKRGCSGWEYESRDQSLDQALDQLKRCALAPPRPPDRALHRQPDLYCLRLRRV